MTTGNRIMVRFDADTKQRLAAHVKRLKKERPGALVTESGAIRELLVQALDAAEKKA
jgi:hypothetical protein